MLVLTRRPDEAIMIGEEIEIMVISVQRNKVRIGIKAPSKIPVFRKEIYLAVRESNKEAVQIPQDVFERIVKQREIFSNFRGKTKNIKEYRIR
jgi:carbon storage regulator